MAQALADAVQALAPTAARARWTDLGRRAASVAVLAPAALGCIWFGGAPWSALVVAAAIGLAVEWAGMGRLPVASPAGLVALAGLPGAVAAGLAGAFPAAGWILGASAVAVCGLTWRGHGPKRAIPVAAGVVYIGLAGLALVLLRADPAVGRANMCFLVLVVWACDTGAYVSGRLFGGPRLAPAISPGKTWAGAAGGFLASICAAWVVASAAHDGGAPLPRLALVAAILGVACEAGDLLESYVKRRFGVKDSGRLIPGHGGLLDRLDGLLAAALAAAVLALSLGSGVVLWR